MAQHQIVFLFLAAGTSSRMRGSDKLLKEIDGVPLIQRILGEALKLNFPVYVTLPVNDTERKLIVSKTNAAIIDPTKYCPSTPILKSPILKPTATAIAEIYNGIAVSYTHLTLPTKRIV